MAGSLGSTLSIARSAMNVAQTGLNTAAHNIANASTPGYSRQTAVQATNVPLVTPQGALGTGVRVVDIARARDHLLDTRFREESAGLGASTRRSEMLRQLESMYLEPSDNGLRASLDRFWSSWSDLSANPASSEARTVVQARGGQLVTHIRRMSTDLDTMRSAVDQHLRASANSLNGFTSRIATINERILAAEAGGVTAGDLRDQRDFAIDELAKLADVQVTLRGNGTVAVAVGDATLVDGSTWQSVTTTSVGGAYRVVTSSGNLVSFNSGDIAADLQILNRDIPNARNQLDNIAAALVTAVNAVHTQGMNAAGGLNISFFDPLGTTATSISLSAAVAANSNAIVAATPGIDAVTGNPVYRAGANNLALQLANLSNAPAGAQVRDLSLTGYVEEVVTTLGMQSRAASDDAQVYGTLAAEADARRQSLIGVSTDEELMKLIQYQNAYAAAARVVTTVDEMMQTLVDMKR
jgi:flagellar hook-associated protein 1